MSTPGLFYHQEVPVTVRIAQVVGLTAAGFLAGQTSATSYMLVPAIMEAPAPLLARQWKKAWDIGKITGPAISLGGGAIFGWLASREPQSEAAFKFYAAAAVLLPGIIPYTFATLKPINDKLLQKAESMASTAITDKAAEAGIAKDETVHALVDRWATLNMGRALITATGAVCAIWASLNPVAVVGFEKIGLKSGADRM